MKLRNLALPFIAFVIASVTAASPAEAACKLGMVAELKVTMRGHRALVPVTINGVETKMIVDSGAFWNTITPGNAVKHHLTHTSESGFALEGVGGQTTNTYVGRAQDFSIAGANFHGVTFVVTDKGLDSGAAGLLGANFLSIADVEYDLANGVIRLFKPDGCSTAVLAYWVGQTQPYSVTELDVSRPGETHIQSWAQVNGQRVRVTFDTGASSSMMSLKAAWKAGVQPTDPNVVPAGVSSGVAQHSYVRTWLAPFASFKLGDEEIKNVKLIIGNMGIDDEMLLGADFFLSHRVLVSNSQRKIYFTYNGGPVFDQKLAPQPSTQQAPFGVAPPPETMDADAYSRRAAALVSRRDFDGALAELSQAIQHAPNEARYLYERAMVYRANAEPKLAMDDLNHAITLQPDFIPALLARATAYGRDKEPALARADLDAADKAAGKDPDQRFAVAETYSSAGFEVEAIAELDQWIAAHPMDDNLAQALNSRCWLRARRNEALDKALDDCNTALRLLPGDPNILDSRGMVHLRLGQFDKAIADYNDSLRINPKSAWSLYGRGLAELRKGMTARGDADLAGAKQLSATIADDAAKRGLTP